MDKPLRVVVIEDEIEIAALIAKALRRDGHEVDVAATGAGGLELVVGTEPDVVILDLGLPDHDGMDVLRDIRKASNEIGVICVTARVEEIDRVLGFESGADDYVSKPFSPRELVGRVKALGRRVTMARKSGSAASGVVAAPVLDTGRVRIAPSRREVMIDGVNTDMTRMEFDLLSYLVAQRGTACTRAAIVETVWGHDWVGNSRTLDVHVGQLRRKLGESLRITTLRGVGYRLEA